MTATYMRSDTVTGCSYTTLSDSTQRTTAFGLGAAFAATWTGGAPWLAFTVAAAVLVAVAEDRQDVAWRGWAYGFAGAVLSLVISPNGEVLPAFIGVLIGGLGLVCGVRRGVGGGLAPVSGPT